MQGGNARRRRPQEDVLHTPHVFELRGEDGGRNKVPGKVGRVRQERNELQQERQSGGLRKGS